MSSLRMLDTIISNPRNFALSLHALSLHALRMLDTIMPNPSNFARLDAPRMPDIIRLACLPTVIVVTGTIAVMVSSFVVVTTFVFVEGLCASYRGIHSGLCVIVHSIPVVVCCGAGLSRSTLACLSPCGASSQVLRLVVS